MTTNFPPELIAQLHDLIEEHTTAAERERAVIREFSAALEEADHETVAQLQAVMDAHEVRRGELATKIAEMGRRVGRLPVPVGLGASRHGGGEREARQVTELHAVEDDQPNNPHGIIYKAGRVA